jgi:alpha-galactosidase
MKLAIVGAGGRFTPGLLTEMVRQPSLAGATVTLFDLDGERAALMERWGRRYVAEQGYGATIQVASQLESALEGAKFVFSTIRVGARDSYEADLLVPARLGIEQGVGDSVGPGGFFASLRQVPVFVQLARTMEAVCPSAWLLNFSNPMTTICAAVARTTSVRAIGLCHGIYGVHRWLAHFLEAPEERLELNHGGINHLTWITELRLDGQDAYPLLWQRYRDKGDGGQPISFRFLELYGQFPSPGDRHVAEFFAHFHRPDARGGKDYGLETAAEQAARDLNRRERFWPQLREEIEGAAALPGRRPGEGDRAMELVAALSGATPVRSGAAYQPPAHMQYAVNVPNTGGIMPDLPEGAIVELFASADGSGIHPRPPGPLAPGVAAALRARLDQQALTVEAALTGDRRLAHQALIADPLVRSHEQAEALLDELLAKHGAQLPQFRP